MYTRGRKGGSLGDSNTSETPNHKISNMEVDAEAQKLADELTKWLEESASRSACRLKAISVKTESILQTRGSSSFCLPSWATVFKSARARGGPGPSKGQRWSRSQRGPWKGSVRRWELWLRLWRPGGWASAWFPVRWSESADDTEPLGHGDEDTAGDASWWDDVFI